MDKFNPKIALVQDIGQQEILLELSELLLCVAMRSYPLPEQQVGGAPRLAVLGADPGVTPNGMEATPILVLLAPSREFLERNSVRCEKHAPGSLDVLREQRDPLNQGELVRTLGGVPSNDPTRSNELLQEELSTGARLWRPIPSRVWRSSFASR
ncbi:hypothetical protein PC116_g6707 [Phytophthora cactorum]|nr:hypothetical protein PC116_g6707 [Phytophthora cactorum]